MAKTRRLALLIDGDNAQAPLLPQIMAEVGKYGDASIRRVYGDWSSPHLKHWNALARNHALKQVQQSSYINGKNATDIALSIDTMEIILTSEIDGVCIVSSDSDYTPLATRIRERGLFVMGIGRRTTSTAFIAACEVFTFTDDLATALENSVAPPADPSTQTPPTPAPAPNGKPGLQKLLKRAFVSESSVDGWVSLSSLGTQLRKLEPDFDAGSYGHSTLSKLVEAHPNLFTIKKQPKSNGSAVVFVRLAKP
jgi:hypothetical protein